MNPKEKTQLIAEFRILKSLVHPNIVQYYQHEHVPDEHTVHLYMEYCGGGDLSGIIKASKAAGEHVSESLVWSVFTQLTVALYRCHFNSDPPPPGELFNSNENISPHQPTTVILHRDIKPDNVFLDEFNTVKLGDFGLAKILDSDHHMASTYVGTPYYMSPEVLLDKPSTPQSDIWSLGCVIYELCAKHPPFQEKTHYHLAQRIKEGKYPPLPSIYSATLSKTIGACLNINALQRPTTHTLLRLDVMKLCRKERDIEEAKRKMEILQKQFILEREKLTGKLQAQKEQHVQFVKKVNDNFKIQVEQEVERRMGAFLQEQSLNTQNQNRRRENRASRYDWQEHQQQENITFNYDHPSPIPRPQTRFFADGDVGFPDQDTLAPPARISTRDHSSSPASSRHSIRSLPSNENLPPHSKPGHKRHSPSMNSNNFSTSKASSMLREQALDKSKSGDSVLDYTANFTYNNAKYSNKTSASSSVASVSTFSSLSSQFTSASSQFSSESYDTKHSSPQTTPKTTPRERQAPHFHAIFESQQTGVSATAKSGGAARGKIKVVPGAVAQRVAQLQKDTQSCMPPLKFQQSLRTDNGYGEDPPGQYLKRREPNRR